MVRRLQFENQAPLQWSPTYQYTKVRITQFWTHLQNKCIGALHVLVHQKIQLGNKINISNFDEKNQKLHEFTKDQKKWRLLYQKKSFFITCIFLMYLSTTDCPVSSGTVLRITRNHTLMLPTNFVQPESYLQCPMSETFPIALHPIWILPYSVHL